MCSWGWILFIFNEFFILIILLNFLIAIISQSYDEVMSREEINRYQSRCELNGEIALIDDKVKELTQIVTDSNNEPSRCFYIVANAYNVVTDNEFLGFVKTIKMTIKRQNKLMKDEIVKSLNAEILGTFSEKFACIGHLDVTVEKEMNDMRR